MSTLHFKLTNIFVVSALAFFFMLWWLIAKDYALTPSYLTSFEGYYESKDQLEVVTVGNSHAVGIDFEALSLGEGRHFFVNGSGIYSAATSVEVLRQELPNLKYVIWPISQGTLERDVRVIERSKNSTRQMVSNLPFNFNVTKNYLIASFDFYFTGQFIRLRSIRWKIDQYVKNLLDLDTLGKRFTQDDSKLRFTYSNGLRERAFLNSPDILKLREHAKIATENLGKDADSLPDYRATANRHFKILKQRLASFNKMGIEIVLVEMPLTPWYREGVVHYKELSDLEHVVKDYPNIHFLRRSSWLDPSLEAGNSFFHDSNHLNRDGAKYFSQHIREYIINTFQR